MSSSSPLRLSVVGVVTLSLFAALFARLWYLQVLDSTTFVEAAERNQVQVLYDEAPRGRILDRNGEVLVDNRRSQAITVNRSELVRLPEAAQAAVLARLGALLNITGEELQRRIDDVRYSQYKPVPVAEDIPEDFFIYIKEHQEDFPAVEATIVSRRAYHPEFPQLAAHVLGYVGEINDAELASRKQDGYRLGDTIGKGGVERIYEADLRGEPGIVKLQVNSGGDVTGEPLAEQAPVPGHDVQLTLDLRLQVLAEESLAQALEAARQSVDRIDRKPFVAPAGSVVVLDPRDGAVLAMASYPTYSPGDFVNGINPDVYRALTDKASYYPLNNRAVSGQYAPGSTFKLVTAVAAAQRGLIEGRTTIVDRGTFTVPNCRGEKCTFKNAGSRAWGRVNLARSLTVSSDVYYYELGARFWTERSRLGNGIQDTAREFGLGTKSGIELPGDRAGTIPDPELRKEQFDKFPGKFVERNWYTGDNVNMSIGQGDVLATPLQLANAYATFANGGTRYAPRVADRVLTAESTPEVVRRIEPRITGKVDLPEAFRGPILEGLRGVIDREEGTAYYAFSGFPPTMSVAGKTGTAQVRGKQDSALFAAFAPADNPQYAVAVILEESGFGGTAAAPVARRVLEGAVGAPTGPIQLGTGSD